MPKNEIQALWFVTSLVYKNPRTWFLGQWSRRRCLLVCGKANSLNYLIPLRQVVAAENSGDGQNIVKLGLCSLSFIRRKWSIRVTMWQKRSANSFIVSFHSRWTHQQRVLCKAGISIILCSVSKVPGSRYWSKRVADNMVQWHKHVQWRFPVYQLHEQTYCLVLQISLFWQTANHTYIVSGWVTAGCNLLNASDVEAWKPERVSGACNLTSTQAMNISWALQAVPSFSCAYFAEERVPCIAIHMITIQKAACTKNNDKR